ncbi:ABC transporter ATP-binding protein [Anaerotignum faecicola]|nr:ABC transporter ATP-binding protein [Anaerotignum faecicola]
MQPIVEIKDLNLVYHSENGETAAVKDLSLCINEGEFVSIVGPSGCGKSTILSMLAGLLEPTSGHIDIKHGSTIGYMLQKDYLFEWRSILSNACLGLEINKALTEEKKEEVKELLRKYGLGDFIYSRPSQLSGGMRQRAALIRTLAMNPDILLLDEPFSALDYQTRLYVSDEISSIIRDEKKTAILVTHDISEAVATSDRVFVLSSRPATLKATHSIELNIPERTPIKSREAKEFNYYFNKIWKELDVHE